MWVILGIAAIFTALLNVVWTLRRRNAKWFRFASISLTALTLCAEYSLVDKWVVNEDWAALMDVVPNMSVALWILTIVSILINGISLFIKSDR